MDATAKRIETKRTKQVVNDLGFTGVKVSHGGSGWLDVHASITKPGDCYCSEVPRNLGRCKNCSDLWYDNYLKIKATVKDRTGRTGEYDGYIQVYLALV